MLRPLPGLKILLATVVEFWVARTTTRTVYRLYRTQLDLQRGLATAGLAAVLPVAFKLKVSIDRRA